jgi:plasmid stabilization system protein ParE
MALKIVFSADALEILLSIINQIENNWGSRQSDKFLENVHKTLDLTAKNPYMFKASSIEEDVRKGLISKQTSFFYEIRENEIIILFFWDNRQEPIFNS